MAKLTEPTVNIQIIEAAKAKSVHTMNKLAVDTTSVEEQLDYQVALKEDICSSHLGQAPEQLGVLGSVSSSEQLQLQQCTSVEVMAAKNLGVDGSLSRIGASPESAMLTCASEKKDEAGEDAGIEGVVLKNKKDGFRFTVDPTYNKNCENEEKLVSTEEEHAAESCVEALEEELPGERMHTEVNGKRVQFSNQVQYFEEDEEFPTGLEDCIEEEDEELDEYLPSEGLKTISDSLKRLLFEKEKCYYVQMDSSEDEMQEDEMSGKKEELADEYVVELGVVEDGVDKKASVERDDCVPSEGEMESGPHEGTQTEPSASDVSISRRPPAVRPEVTLHQLQWPQHRPCNLTSVLPSCQHTLPLIIDGKTPPSCVAAG